ncbi:hypothetical protein KIP31_21115 [Xanthomonas campestris pv. campestris]|uniref:hypothetical protein n=1 Tax=Xanthomonas campestris TaxID=339 RepID=UPI001F3D5518|nr:hypothetical protein [Xanthomonas campestris]MCF8811755.1 hypothetical protein [Xanthomonas campestris pv. campestris]MCW2003550.1 hypothetical protein [Xanthomonas campestris]
MHSKRISFANLQKDGFGMPTQYQSYLVIARLAESGEANEGDGVARVYSMSTHATPLNPDYVVAAGGPEKAIEAAFVSLRVGKEDLIERIFPGEPF